MKTFTLALALTLIASAALAADTIKLPAPQKTGGPALFNAIDQRASATPADFPEGELSESDLSTLLWAASGHNRDGRLWTVPMAMGKPPYCKIYVAGGKGAYLYNWQEHSLEPVNSEDLTDRIPVQPFAQYAPMTMVITSDASELAQLSGSVDEFALVLAGAMSQNIYLAGEGLNIGARVIYSIKREDTTRLLKLDKGDKALFGIVLGKYE